MHKNLIFNLYPALNAIFGEGICDILVSANDILCFVHFLVGFTPEMLR